YWPAGSWWRWTAGCRASRSRFTWPGARSRRARRWPGSPTPADRSPGSVSRPVAVGEGVAEAVAQLPGALLDLLHALLKSPLHAVLQQFQRQALGQQHGAEPAENLLRRLGNGHRVALVANVLQMHVTDAHRCGQSRRPHVDLRCHHAEVADDHPGRSEERREGKESE